MANPLYGQNKHDNSADLIIGEKGKAYVRRNVISIIAQTAETDLTAAQTGSLVVLAGTPTQIQVLNLPTVKPENVGIYYDFVVNISGNSGAAGSYTINTGGHATDDDSATKGYDDFVGTVKVLDGTAYTAADKTNAVPASGEGTLVLALNTTNAEIAVGSSFRLTAIAASTIGTASADVWLIEGTIMSTDATGFVTGALFTAP